MNKKITLIFLITLLSLFLIALFNLCCGSVNICVKDLFLILGGNKTNSVFYRIIWDLRLPRLAAAFLMGGALSLSGYLLQTFFMNPIAGPYVLGISSGAKLSVAFLLIFFLKNGIAVSSSHMILAAFTGSVIVMLIVLLFSAKVSSMSVLIVCGILIGYVCSAVIDFIITFASDQNIVALQNWNLGGFSGISWKNIGAVALIVIPSFFIILLLSKPISAFLLGENYARNMGVNVKLLRVVLILFSSLLSACVTAFAGPISFVGIAVPHLVKTITKSSKPLVLIPLCFCGGAFVCIFCDGIARMLFSPVEVNVSSVTAVLLVPVVIYLMLKRDKK